ncbi:MAG: hypothetical protein MI924_10515 [Chloroflexales bacterium]|nr:hypothetical protein [Chloroflexales bacterium]
MGHYPLDELIERWRREDLTVEQMIGQMLQVLREQEHRLREVRRLVPSVDMNGMEREKQRG